MLSSGTFQIRESGYKTHTQSPIWFLPAVVPVVHLLAPHGCQRWHFHCSHLTSKIQTHHKGPETDKQVKAWKDLG